MVSIGVSINWGREVKCDTVHMEYYKKTGKDVDILHQVQLFGKYEDLFTVLFTELVFPFFAQLVLTLVEGEFIFHG